MKSIERALNQAVSASMPDMNELLDNILEADVIPMTNPDSIVRQQPPKQRSEGFIIWLKDIYSSLFLQPALLFSLCIVLLLSLSGGVALNTIYMRTDTLVAIDVNPSIELSTNKKNKVISINAKNKDANIILEDMELINVDLNIAVNAIIGSMLKHGYLQDDENTILISVSNKKEAKAKQIQNKIEKDFVDSLKIVDKRATCIKQKFSKSNALEKMADELNISIGKLQFINQILELDDTLDINILAGMSMNELKALAQEYETLAQEYELPPKKPVSTPQGTQNKPYSTESEDKSDDTQDDGTTEGKNNHKKHDNISDNNNPGKLDNDSEDTDDSDWDDDEDWDIDWDEEDWDDPSDIITPESPGKLGNTKPTEDSYSDEEE